MNSKRTYLLNVLQTHQLRRDPAVHAEELAFNQCRYRECLERLDARFVHRRRVLVQALTLECEVLC